jgi:hypothetical protein
MKVVGVFVRLSVIAFALPRRATSDAPCTQLNDGDIVDYIMLCAGAGVTGCKEIY